jgi:uncharacterized membrane protein
MDSMPVEPRNTEQMLESKRPLTILAGPHGHPLHPALVAIPLGCWVGSWLFDVASRLVDDPSFLAPASRWLIAIGVVGALVAAAVGFLDLLGIPRGTSAFGTALVHMTLNLVATAGFAVGFALRAGTEVGERVAWNDLALSTACLGAITVAGYLGGKLVFRYGVRVVEESTQADGYRVAGHTSKEA